MHHFGRFLNIVKRLSLLLGITLIRISPTEAATQPVSVDLHSYGFALGQVDPPGDAAFYISSDRIALFFDRGEIADSINQKNHTGLHQFVILVVNTKGQVLAQQTINGMPNELDITPGPNGGLIVGQEGSLSFYNADLHLGKSMPLSPNVTRVSFSRKWNQLVIATIDRTSHTRTAHLIDGGTLKEIRSFTFPERSTFLAGNRQIAYTEPGYCEKSTRILSPERTWEALNGLPICGMLTFVGDDALAYTFDQDLYVVDNHGKKLIQQTIPPPPDISFPFFAGISDDNSRIAISTWRRKFFRKPEEFPEYKEVFVFDLRSHKRILSRSLASGGTVSALSPDGMQLATIENGVLMLNAVP